MAARKTVARVGGELVVIVVGVLIALSADAWFRTLEERREERASLVALRAEFEASLGHLAESNAAQADVFSALRRIVEEDLTQLPLDSVADLVYTGLFRLGRFFPRVSALRAMEATNRFQLLPAELRTELSELNRRMQLVREADDDFLAAQRDIIDPFLVSRLYLGQAFADSDSLGVSRRTSSTLDVRLLTSPAGQSVVLFKTSIATIGVPRREELEDQLNALIVLIDRRITELRPS